jgi:hypothetical protein
VKVDVAVKGGEGVGREELLLGADRVGAASVSCVKLAKAAGVGTRTAWGWLNAENVTRATDRAIRRALGLPLLRR